MRSPIQELRNRTPKEGMHFICGQKFPMKWGQNTFCKSHGKPEKNSSVSIVLRAF